MDFDLSSLLSVSCLVVIAYATLKTAGVVAKGVNEIISGLQAIYDRLDALDQERRGG